MGGQVELVGAFERFEGDVDGLCLLARSRTLATGERVSGSRKSVLNGKVSTSDSEVLVVQRWVVTGVWAGYFRGSETWSLASLEGRLSRPAMMALANIVSDILLALEADLAVINRETSL